MSKIVLALGGNALGDTLEEQVAATKVAAAAIVQLIADGHNVIVAHGNGPQVGMISLAFEAGSKAEPKVFKMPLYACTAMSQGYIGFDLQNSLREELISKGINKPVCSIVTQVRVDDSDPAFSNPTKPIGGFYSEEEARQLEAQGLTMVEDSGRGYRQVVASPKPIDIVEKDSINAMIAANHLVIACGGGGIPVVAQGNGLKGVPAVIDKDFAAAKLAEIIDADYFIILTAVEKVALNFGKPDEKLLDSLSIEQARQYIGEGHFAKGSMLPKVEAAVNFASSKPGRKALITMLHKAKDGIDGKTGTVIIQE
ncbi:MAG: carbamate kinase [Defluviitaleaceae bacterium]|nr:carbamate kinase [Defluviitaleaceae bacterium]